MDPFCVPPNGPPKVYGTVSCRRGAAREHARRGGARPTPQSTQTLVVPFCGHAAGVPDAIPASGFDGNYNRGAKALAQGCVLQHIVLSIRCNAGDSQEDPERQSHCTRPHTAQILHAPAEAARAAWAEAVAASSGSLGPHTRPAPTLRTLKKCGSACELGAYAPRPLRMRFQGAGRARRAWRPQFWRPKCVTDSTRPLARGNCARQRLSHGQYGQYAPLGEGQLWRGAIVRGAIVARGNCA